MCAERWRGDEEEKGGGEEEEKEEDVMEMLWGRELAETVPVDGRLSVRQAWSASGGAICATVWEAAFALVETLLQREGDGNGNGVRGRRVLELGAGTGYVGVCAARLLGAEAVMLTDLEEALPLLRENADAANEANHGEGEESRVSTVSVEKLAWGEPLPDVVREHPPDVLLGADLIYGCDADVYDRLATTIDGILRLPTQKDPPSSSASSCRCFLANMRRIPREEESVLAMLRARGLCVAQIAELAETQHFRELVPRPFEMPVHVWEITCGPPGPL